MTGRRGLLVSLVGGAIAGIAAVLAFVRLGGCA